MSKSKIEIAARALCEASGGKPDALDIIKEVRADTLPADAYDEKGLGAHYYWRKWTKHAIAVIAALEAIHD